MSKAVLKLNVDGKVYYSDNFTLPTHHPKYVKAKELIDNFNIDQMNRERRWRNSELSGSDWMLVEDATYNGKELVGSTELVDIKAYRQTLREYNLTSEPRPERPAWYKG